jgi:hypothetical protein
MSKTYDHNGNPAGHGKVQVNAKNVETVMLPVATSLPKNVRTNSPRHI